ncbi:hypothetical protein F0562_008501 [Nyssa sinensis]|uniref:Riboflavin kinase n=1 Tax=Nyssa sinensis TaxID=561372 RepID=A0A5J5A916_9ASTE|nr:hypothetical protein F0562_008501 [Nyssa sinensis]
MIMREAATAIIKDYDLPITPDRFIQEIRPMNREKFLEAANKMGVDAVCCLVIEDSLIGVQAAKAAGMKVVAVPSIQRKADQFSIADSVLQSLVEFHPELWGLPPFEDSKYFWVDNALPVEPFYLRGLCSSGLLNEFADCRPSVLPDQVSGLYFGWAKVDTRDDLQGCGQHWMGPTLFAVLLREKLNYV